MQDLSHCSEGSNSGNRNKPPWCLMSCVELIEDRVLTKPRGCFMELLPVSSCCEVTVVDALDETFSKALEINWTPLLTDSAMLFHSQARSVSRRARCSAGLLRNHCK